MVILADSCIMRIITKQAVDFHWISTYVSRVFILSVWSSDLAMISCFTFVQLIVKCIENHNVPGCCRILNRKKRNQLSTCSALQTLQLNGIIPKIQRIQSGTCTRIGRHVQTIAHVGTQTTSGSNHSTPQRHVFQPNWSERELKNHCAIGDTF